MLWRCDKELKGSATPDRRNGAADSSGAPVPAQIHGARHSGFARAPLAEVDRTHSPVKSPASLAVTEGWTPTLAHYLERHI
jgi:hypothetical protein